MVVFVPTSHSVLFGGPSWFCSHAIYFPRFYSQIFFGWGLFVNWGIDDVCQFLWTTILGFHLTMCQENTFYIERIRESFAAASVSFNGLYKIRGKKKLSSKNSATLSVGCVRYCSSSEWNTRYGPFIWYFSHLIHCYLCRDKGRPWRFQVSLQESDHTRSASPTCDDTQSLDHETGCHSNIQ